MQSKPEPDEPFDFDAWSQLAQSDPEAFEAHRRAVLDRAIAAVPAPRRERLHQLQWKLDMERRRARTPLGACVRLHRLMLDQVADRFAPALRDLAGQKQWPARAPCRRADILPLRTPRRR